MSLIHRNRFVAVSTPKTPKVVANAKPDRPTCEYCMSSICDVGTFPIGLTVSAVQECLERQRSIICSLIEDEYYNEVITYILGLQPMWDKVKQSGIKMPTLKHIESILLGGFAEKRRERFAVLLCG